MRKLAQYILQKNLVGVKFEGLLSKEYWIHSLQYLRKKLFDLSIGLFHYSNIPLLFRAFIMGLVVCILCFSNNARAQNLAPEFASIETMVGDSLGASINQAGSDSVNIRQMVQDQIEAARKKQLEEQSQAQLLAATKAKESNTQVMESFFVNVRKGIPLSDDLLIKILILGSAGILVSIVIIIRSGSMKKGAGDKELKRNIKLLREEKLPGKKNKKRRRSPPQW